MSMPEKTGLWEQVLQWLQNALPVVGGFSMGTVIAYIRERRTGTRWRQSLGEALMCGLLSVGTIRLINWWLSRSGNTDEWELLAEFCGVAIGFLGTEKLYALFEGAVQIIKNRFGGTKSD